MKSLPIHGRGASFDPPNRFTELQVERDGWLDPDDPGPGTRLYRDSTRSIITTNDSPDVGFDASVNPYRGCEHGCVYCMDGDTPVLMGDASSKPLSAVRAGDEIYGTVRRGFYRRYVRTQVLAHWQTEKLAYRITLADGTALVASGDHRFLSRRGWKHVTGTEQGADRRPHLTTNDRLLGVGSAGEIPSPTEEYRIGYLCGMIRGDGLGARYEYPSRRGGGGSRQHHFRLALADPPGLDRTESYLRNLGIRTNRFVHQAGKLERREIRGIRTRARHNVESIARIIEWPEHPSREWARGYLAGIFDAEGSYSCGVLRISNTDEDILLRLQEALQHFGFDLAREKVVVRRKNPIGVIRVRGGLREHLRFFHLTSPAISRKLDFTGTALKSDADLRVVSIEPVGFRTLFDITTGTGDFIADGVVSHNCYARPNHEYLGLSAGLDFETKIFVKEDAPELLRAELASPKWTPKVLAMSGVTDPYQPAERRLGITRGCLEVLAEARNPVAIVTKNHLVTRDADLLAELARHDAARVMLSITTLRNEVQRVMEPRAVVPARRLRAVRELADAGVEVGVMVAPVVPGLTEHEMAEILEAAAEAGATRAAFILLRLPHAVKELFAEWLEQHFPDRRDKVLNRLRSLRSGRLNDPRFGSRMKGEGPYAEQIRQLFDVTCARLGLNEDARSLSTAAFRRPRVDGEQLGLF